MTTRPIRAVLLDVDGTLYHQDALRCLIAFELSALPLAKGSYRLAVHVWRVLRCFRRVREELRRLGSPTTSLAELQYVETAKRTGTDPAEVEQIVAEWIDQRPLKYLRLCRRCGIEGFLAFLESKAVHIGVFSDYPTLNKLQALGLSCRTMLALCATDPDINAFKPHPKGFLRACATWGLPPEEVLYVGDRSEVDAIGAAAAGMRCAILIRRTGARTPQGSSGNCITFSSFPELQHGFILSSTC
jgi:HAD superfamily hydrolase (TIGR01549 family)